MTTHILSWFAALLLLVLLHTSTGNDCSFEVVIDNSVLTDSAELQCFESSDANGLKAQIQVGGSKTNSIIVWDPDAPCGPGRTYIHYVGSSGFSSEDFLPMTAGAGATIHTYHAALFAAAPPLVELGVSRYFTSTTTTFMLENMASDAIWNIL